MIKASTVTEIEKRYNLPHRENPDLEYIEGLVKIDNDDRRDDSHRSMAWFSLSGLVIYPVLVIFTDFVGLDKASQLISDMSGVYFASMSAIVMTLFGANAFKSAYFGRDTNRSSYCDQSGQTYPSSSKTPYDPR